MLRSSHSLIVSNPYRSMLGALVAFGIASVSMPAFADVTSCQTTDPFNTPYNLGATVSSTTGPVTVTVGKKKTKTVTTTTQTVTATFDWVNQQAWTPVGSSSYGMLMPLYDFIVLVADSANVTYGGTSLSAGLGIDTATGTGYTINGQGLELGEIASFSVKVNGLSLTSGKTYRLIVSVDRSCGVNMGTVTGPAASIDFVAP